MFFYEVQVGLLLQDAAKDAGALRMEETDMNQCSFYFYAYVRANTSL